MRKLIFLFIILLIPGINSYADNVRLVADAPDAVAVGDQFRITYTVNTQNVKSFRASSMKGLDVLAGPYESRMTSSQYINGKGSTVSSITYTYTVMASAKGTFSISPASIVADGRSVTSNALKIRVLPADQANRGSSSSSPSKSSRSKSSGTKVSAEDLIIVGSVNKTNVYEQEALVLTYKVYTLVDLRGFDNVKLPDFKGFQSQEVELPQTKQFTLERYKGKNYHSVVYRQFVLFPQQSGKLVINPARFDASIAKAVQTADPFDAFFNGGSNVVEVKKTIVTPQITVNVNSLPAGKPANFCGGVGGFTLSSTINSKEVKTNDAVTIKVTISGVGNLKLINTPKIQFPKDFEVYDPKVTNKFTLTKGGLSGSKVIEYLVIPRYAGAYKIPSASLTYFDSNSRSYKTLKTQEYDLKVAKGAGNADQVVANFTNKEDLKVLGSDIRYIKTNDVTLHEKGDFLFGSLLYYLLYIIPACLFIAFIIIYRNQAVENANVAKVRTKKANKVATKRMKIAGKLLNENKKEEFYDEVLKALWGYISDKLNIQVSKLTKDNVESELTNYGVNAELTKEFLSVLDQCEFARYAPGDPNEAMDKVYSSAIEVVSKMENIIKH
ncbi:BatD family protein [uncultured Bacteroides sp.]|uniref:BatD family protein n=1 Tax=uncultured Bacteroides sp. TaxID=162156 RepID=UPI002AAAD081|nr:BatD family protein [uncultured Bacteroides sp.]